MKSTFITGATRFIGAHTAQAREAERRRAALVEQTASSQPQ